MNNVILTTSIDYSLKQLINFVRSIDFKCDLIIFTNKKLNGIHDFLFEEVNLKLIYVPNEEYKFELNTPNNIRLLWYLKYLQLNLCDAVFITDIRDVVFQNNPFEYSKKLGLIAAREDVKFKDEKYNADWIRLVYGEEVLEKIKNQFVYCSGTILGEYQAILDYLHFFEGQIKKCGSKHDRENKNNIIDQAIFNFYLLNHRGEYYSNINDDGPILTCGYSNIVKVNHKNQLVNSRNLPYSVIHQYDRRRWMSLLFNDMYFPKSRVLKRIEKFFMY